MTRAFAGGRPTAAALPRAAAPGPLSPAVQGWKKVLGGPGGGRAVCRCSPAPLQPIRGHPATRSDLTKIAANACD